MHHIICSIVLVNLTLSLTGPPAVPEGAMALHACPPRAPLFQTSSQVLRHSTACYRWHRGTASQQVNKARLVCRDGPSKAATDADSQQPAHRVTDSDRSTQQETGRNAAAMGAYLAASGLVSFLAFQQLSSTDLPPVGPAVQERAAQC